jgi:hypothetical protein
VLPDLQKHFLQDFLRNDVVAKNVPGKRKQATGIPIVDLLECLTIAFGYKGKQFSLSHIGHNQIISNLPRRGIGPLARAFQIVEIFARPL